MLTTCTGAAALLTLLGLPVRLELQGNAETWLGLLVYLLAGLSVCLSHAGEGQETPLEAGNAPAGVSLFPHLPTSVCLGTAGQQGVCVSGWFVSGFCVPGWSCKYQGALGHGSVPSSLLLFLLEKLSPSHLQTPAEFPARGTVLNVRLGSALLPRQDKAPLAQQQRGIV